LEKESKKKTRHKSFRVLQEQAPDVLTSLKPCWMMSPLMVSQVLPPIALFDFVIFDEASQIRPEDAVCAIARGKQTVVAGDDRQLPPSKFFDGGDDDLEEDDEVEEALTKGYESILDVTSAILPERMLEWHYRSRDERLIALSNSHIYKGALTTFPGSMTESPIHWHYIDHMPTRDGETTSNATEVNKVVDLVLDHAHQYLADEEDTNVDEDIDHETLGVIAFGQPHATAIENELYSRLKELRNPRLDDFFDSERPEPFFVKNLERVQGDERDCIILSVGYGKNSDGAVPQRFGPINQQGGERRVNVAVSRARSKMTVVSSIQESDITNESSNKGRSILKALLKFAKSKGNDVGIEGNQVPLNAFELRVLNELEDLDLTVIPQYGVGKFRIDFAVADPDDINKMVLAVEADGATYHSSPTARDRDRLRQQVLEDKGWRFVRIWSTDFFKDPKAEAQRVHTALQRALRGEEDLVDAEEQGPGLSAGNSATTRTRAYVAKPYLTKGQPVETYDPQQLVAMVNWITQGGEKLLTNEDIISQMMEELGYKKRGSKILEHFDLAIKRSRGEVAIPSGETPLKSADSARPSTKKQAAKKTAAKKKASAKKKNSSGACSCGGRMVRRTGPHGAFYGCSNYPRCRKTRNSR
jgi:very-short-patch-repair endonuclease